MKKFGLRMYLVILVALCSLGNIQASDHHQPMKTDPSTIVTPPPPEVQHMMDRVKEIQKMDFSKMSKAERKQLRSELKSTRKHLRTVEAVYIPVTTLVIIALLLLLI